MTAGCGFAFGIRGGVAASRFVSGRANGTGCAARTIGGFTGCAGTVAVASGTVVRHKRVRETFLQRREIRPASAYQQDNAKNDSGQFITGLQQTMKISVYHLQKTPAFLFRLPYFLV